MEFERFGAAGSIREMLGRSGLSARAASSALGKSPDYIGSLLSKGSDIRMSTFAGIADACGYDVVMTRRAGGDAIALDGSSSFLCRHRGFLCGGWHDFDYPLRDFLIICPEDGSGRAGGVDYHWANAELYAGLEGESADPDDLPCYGIVADAASGRFTVVFSMADSYAEPSAGEVALSVHGSLDEAARRIEAMAAHMGHGGCRDELAGLLRGCDGVLPGSDLSNNLVLYASLKVFDDGVAGSGFCAPGTDFLSIHLWASCMGLYPVGVRGTVEDVFIEEDDCLTDADGACKADQERHMRERACRVDGDYVTFELDDVGDCMFVLDRGQLEDLIANHLRSVEEARRHLLALAGSGAVPSFTEDALRLTGIAVRDAA